MREKKHGKIIWITGLSGSGKSTIGEKLKNLVKSKYGQTVIVHGDDIRDIYKFKFYSRIERLKLGKANSNLCRLLSKQGLNVIFTTVGLFHELFTYNRKNLKNYLEIYIKTDLKKLLKNKNKSFYKIRTKNVWGLDLKPQFPKNSDIIIENNFDKSATKLAKIIYEKIKKE
jgi:adenylylsulfate kinase-like enzyme